jgi:hypothetical protein
LHKIKGFPKRCSFGYPTIHWRNDIFKFRHFVTTLFT